jgi:hypothetical protein
MGDQTASRRTKILVGNMWKCNAGTASSSRTIGPHGLTTSSGPPSELKQLENSVASLEVMRHWPALIGTPIFPGL